MAIARVSKAPTKREVFVRRANPVIVAVLVLTACASEGVVQPAADRPHAVNISASGIAGEHDSVTVFGVRGGETITLSTLADSAAWVSALRTVYSSKEPQKGSGVKDKNREQANTELKKLLSNAKDIRDAHELLTAQNGAVDRHVETQSNGKRVVRFTVGGISAARFSYLSRANSAGFSRIPVPTRTSLDEVVVDCSVDPASLDCASPSAAVQDGISLSASVNASMSDAGALYSSASAGARGACDGAMNAVLATGGAVIGMVIGAEVAADLGAIPVAWWLIRRIPSAGFGFWLAYQNLQDCLRQNGTPKQYPPS